MSHRSVLTDGVSFQEGVESYLRACPGPALAEQGLRLAAYQRVAGIPWLEPSALRGEGNGRSVRSRGGAGRYLRSISDIAAQVNCRPSYLSDAALRRGYSYSRALRWLRFIHGLCLRETRTPVLDMVWSLGFSDPSGWTRFTKTLIGKTPRQIPRAPMEFWVRMAIEHVYLNAGIRNEGGSTGQQDMRNGN